MSQKRLPTSDFQGKMRVESMASAMRALSSQRGSEAGSWSGVRTQEASPRGAESLLASGRPTKATVFAEQTVGLSAVYLLHLIAL